ncbi:MAG: hypothetical protein JWM71_1862 [Solirubrobacteraceae bacterium]|nr:hypothetical protein [Solirubrobacteraceae bacterium]
MLPARSVLIAAVSALLLALPAAASAAHGHAKLATYEVGIGSESIAVNSNGTFGGGPVYLGGYGIGGPSAVGPGLGDRHATGNLGVGPSVRAIVIGDGTHYMAVADAELQGWFAAAKDGPYGIMDVRKQVAAATHGALPADRVIVQSDHSHGGPDLLGVWGGATTAYRAYVVKQTVAAIVDAYNARRSGNLYYGTAAAGDLLHNQFDFDKANQSMDSDVRVLQARDRHGNAFATLLNFSAHPTVLGSDNTLATGDWVQAANPQLEAAFGGRAMTMVGTLGRTQPNRDTPCPDPQQIGEKDPAYALCKLDGYAKLVVARAKDAAASAQPLTGPAEVVAKSFLVTDTASSPLLLGMLYGGAPLGLPVNRSMTPPFLTGNVLGTITGSARIGDVLLSSGPGEMYPQIPLKVRSVMEGLGAHVRGFMTAGLADDQLGYLIAPYEAYPEPIKTSFFDSSFANGDVVGSCTTTPGATCAGDPTPQPIGNDNYFFNVSHTMGERVTCSLLRGAGDVFGLGKAARKAYGRCVMFANDAVAPEGEDVTLSDKTAGLPTIPATFPPAP